MLPRENRMRSGAEFSHVMRAGRRAGRESLAVSHVPGPDGTAAGSAAPPRVGFIVSKAVGGAVVRKRVQRRLRHLMRDRTSLLAPGSLLVVRAKPSAATQASDLLGAQLDGALRSVLRPNATRRRKGRDDHAPRTAHAGTDLAK
ncbi:ribonuclease P protein component [Murinocardiopsis flavida]|uniref:Ribonuclease P protein component n=1 Tax=Murinocardiopsis flavida TaxID=645275 RepID=A0A2P8DE76_9ACTN|nr:ribonuclease P protein component [Murinocardiopsis flavida]PSK95518.1 ribonuclease P protein component [Murinocardiopsis flavida]